MSVIENFLSNAAPYLHAYGYPVLFATILLECFGLPVPGETMLIAAAVLAGRHEMSLAAIIPVAWSAAVLGDNVGYALGRFAGRRLIVKYGSYVGVTRARLLIVEDFFRKYGSGIVVIARFLPAARQLNGIVAGTVAMPWWRFLLYNAIGAALWVGFWSFAGHYAGDHASRFLHWIGQHVWLAAGLAVVGLAAAGVLYVRFRKRERRAAPSPRP